MLNHPILPAILLAISGYRLLSGTATWWTAVSIVAAALWLFTNVKRRQDEKNAAESPRNEDALQTPASPRDGPPAITHEQIQHLRAMLATNERRRKGELPEQQLPSEEQILATSTPAILLRRSTLPVPLDHPARSYIGGLPRMPAELAWPEIERHETFAMTFLAQIDLSELPLVEGSGLPREGTLYFFADMNDECPETDSCRVLYHAGGASNLPQRELPANSRPYGIGDEPWPWLPETSVWARASFRFPLTFTVFDSMRDYLVPDGANVPPARNREVSRKLMAAELARRFAPHDPPPKDVWSTFTEDRDAWPFAWAAVEFGARSVAYTARQAADRREAVAVKAELDRIAEAAEAWVARAARESPQAACDGETRNRFLGEWRNLAAKTLAIARPLGIPARDAGRELSNVLMAACYVCASNGSADSIPQPYREALDHLNDAGAGFPGHQMLGHGEKVQWAPIHHADDVLLLQMLGDYALGWHTNSGCAYQFWICREALQARDFDAVEMTLECD